MALINKMSSEGVLLYLSEEFIDIPTVLSHSLDKVIKPLDKIAGLPAAS
jgi:hypothetical protein